MTYYLTKLDGLNLWQEDGGDSSRVHNIRRLSGRNIFEFTSDLPIKDIAVWVVAKSSNLDELIEQAALEML